MEYEEYLEQGETLAGEGLIEEALGRFEQALAAAPENPVRQRPPRSCPW